jgi:hypothetical protein
MLTAVEVVSAKYVMIQRSIIEQTAHLRMEIITLVRIVLRVISIAEGFPITAVQGVVA